MYLVGGNPVARYLNSGTFSWRERCAMNAHVSTDLGSNRYLCPTRMYNIDKHVPFER